MGPRQTALPKPAQMGRLFHMGARESEAVMHAKASYDRNAWPSDISALCFSIREG